MKKVLTNNIVQNLRDQRLPKSSFEHLMNAYAEGFEALLLSLGFDPTKVSIVASSVLTVNGQDFDITAGWGAYQGEIFEIDAANFTAPGGEIGVWVIDETYLGSDPVRFSDGNQFNVNQIRKLKLQSGASGSGIADHDETAQYDTGWIDFEYQNGAQKSTNGIYPGGHADPGYRKVGNTVHLRGAVDRGSAEVIATLPEGFRPSGQITIPAERLQGTANLGNIGSNGKIDANDATDILLDFISFPV